MINPKPGYYPCVAFLERLHGEMLCDYEYRVNKDIMSIAEVEEAGDNIIDIFVGRAFSVTILYWEEWGR